MSYTNQNLNNNVYAQQPGQYVQPVQGSQLASGLPSNQSALNQIDKASYALNQAQQSSQAQLLGPSGLKVLQDAQTLLQDQKNIVAHRNEGDALQKVIHDVQVLGQKLGGKVQGGDVSMFKSLVNDWQQIFKSIAGGDEVNNMANSGSALFRGLADTEEFLDLVSELINLIKVLVSTTDAKLTKDSSTNRDLGNQLDAEREAVMEKLRITLHTLQANDLWTHLVQQGKVLAHRSAQEARGAAHDAQAAAQQAAPQVQGNIWATLDSQEMHMFTEDMKQFLQRLVGDEHSVAPLFDYTKAALRDIKNDPELHKAIHEAEDTLHSVSMGVNEAVQDPTPVNHTANPAYNAMTQHHSTMTPSYSLEKSTSGDVQKHADEAQKHLKSVGDHLEAALNNIRSNQNLHRAREEAHILREAFLNDPVNHQLIADARQLWQDLQSPYGGGIDPTLLIGLREAIVPIFLEQFNNVPIPAIHNTVSMLGKMDISIDGIKLSIPQILPDNLYVKFEYEMDTTLRSLDVNAQRLFLHLELRNIHVHLRNVAWAYQRLSHPRRSDSGHVDVDTLGDGITVSLKVQMHHDNTVEVKETHVKIQKFKTHFTDSKHNKMYNGLSHVFANQIKKNMTASLETKMKEMGAQVGSKMMKTANTARTQSSQILGVAMGKKTQVFDLLRTKRGQHQPHEGGAMKARVQKIRENQFFQGAVHKAATSANSALDEQQRRVEGMKEEAHEHRLDNERNLNAVPSAQGFAPSFPNTNRPASPPVPAMTFISGANYIDNAPITQGHGLSHVTPNSTIDTQPITDSAHHTLDPNIQRSLEEKLTHTKL